MGAARNVIEAAHACQKVDGRLLSINSCESLEMFRQELLYEGHRPGDTFLFGLIANGFRDYATRRRSSTGDYLVTS